MDADLLQLYGRVAKKLGWRDGRLPAGARLAPALPIPVNCDAGAVGLSNLLEQLHLDETQAGSSPGGEVDCCEGRSSSGGSAPGVCDSEDDDSFFDARSWHSSGASGNTTPADCPTTPTLLSPLFVGRPIDTGSTCGTPCGARTFVTERSAVRRRVRARRHSTTDDMLADEGCSTSAPESPTSRATNDDTDESGSGSPVETCVGRARPDTRRSTHKHLAAVQATQLAGGAGLVGCNDVSDA